MRKSGILMPIFSLPSPYGIGTFGKAAYDFVDFLVCAGQSLWQILPLNPTEYGNSPYSSVSSFAGNPFFIDLDILIEDGLLKVDDLKKVDFGQDYSKVDYDKLIDNRYDVLRKAYASFNSENDEFISFIKENEYWLDAYVSYTILKQINFQNSFDKWEKGREYSSQTVKELKRNTDYGFYAFLQFEFNKQWTALKKYANKKGIEIVGDIPIYVAYDSADVWSNTSGFLLDKNYKPSLVAGCPPDDFSKEGQMWGNPLYNWDKMEKDGYAWWKQRIAHAFKLYDIVRIDHFRGFESYYAIPYGDKTAVNGKWQKGPDIKLFNALKEEFGELNIIAEDLGFLTADVKKLLKMTGFPGMKILQFAFNSGANSDYLPHNHIKNSVVYTGTHDNNTVLGWAKEINNEDRKYAIDYMSPKQNESINWCMIRWAYSSVADTAIVPIQDFIGAGSEARINIPSTVGDNWSWRIGEGCTNSWLAGIIYDLVKLYSRLPERKEKCTTN